MRLIKKLESQLEEFDKKQKKRDMEERRKERLAYVGVGVNNVLPAKEPSDHHKPKNVKGTDSDDSDVSGSDSDSSSSSDSDEPIYQLRERRQAHSYRFNDYDDLINSAIQVCKIFSLLICFRFLEIYYALGSRIK